MTCLSVDTVNILSAQKCDQHWLVLVDCEKFSTYFWNIIWLDSAIYSSFPMADSDGEHGWFSWEKKSLRFYHLPPGFISLRKEESLPELSPQTPVSGYSWPRRTQVADKAVLHFVLGLPCRLVHSRGVHSFALFVHLLSLNGSMCPAHLCIPVLITSMISFTPVWCRIQVLGLCLWSRMVMPSMMRSILCFATDSSSTRAFFNAHVSLPYIMTGNTYSLCTFLFTFIPAFLLFMMFATLRNATHPSAMRLLISRMRSPACVTILPRYACRSTFSTAFPSTTTVDVVAFSLSITLVLLRKIFRTLD